jgi:biopolymer transport protein ExbD
MMRSRIKKYGEESDSSFMPNVLPLIDVVFLLLVFFVISSTFIRHNNLNINLPQANNAKQLVTNSKEIVVSVDSNGNYAVDSLYIPSNKRKDLVNALLNKLNGKRLPLVISADSQANYQSIITLLDISGKLGFSRVRLSTRQKLENTK